MGKKLPMMIAVRGFAVPLDKIQKAKTSKEPTHKYRKALARPSDFTLIFDTETTTDHAQNLRIGSYQVRKRLELVEKGLFYEPANLTANELKFLERYARERVLVLLTREDFVTQIFYRYGYDYGGLILGFNLPFDLSRLAINISTSHGKDMRGGFSLELLEVKWRVHPLVKHLNSKAAFIRFASPPLQVDGRSMRKKGFKSQAKPGYFQDVKTLAAALLGRPHSLESLAELLQTDHQKLDTDEHGGPLTLEYIDYAVNDTDVTWDCYVKLRQLYEAHSLTETPPHRIYSEASLGKAYLNQMGVQPWTKLQLDFPQELTGTIMSTYYGGRAEVRIRRQIVRVLYCDFRSMYPTVCTLMGLWQFVIAEGVDWGDSTEEARGLLDHIKNGDLQKPDSWKSVTTLVQIAPDDDIFPVRARYDEGSRTIGLNHLSAEFGLWYTFADCIASKLLTGKSPKILRAIKFTPRGRQAGLRPIAVGGNSAFTIDPNSDDFYKRVIELRGRIQIQEECATKAGRLEEAEQLEAYQQMLKLLANSTSYGIFAEMNVASYDRARKVACYGSGAEKFETYTKSVEEPGTHFHPLLATLITGAARLMLAMAERVAIDEGLSWAFCDTDSLALAKPEGMADREFLERALRVTKWFDPLSPYADGKPLFKVEKENFQLDRGEPTCAHEPLYAYAISAKRYELFNIASDGKPVIRKAMAHGLGHLRAPYKERDTPSSIPPPVFNLKKDRLDRWHYDLWYQIALAALEEHPDQIDLSDLTGLDQPAVSRYAATSPQLLRWFDSFNRSRKQDDRVRAFNFMLAYQVSAPAIYDAVARGKVDGSLLDDGIPAIVAPSDDDPKRALSRCFDRRTGLPVSITILANYREAIAQYHLHSESKFGNAEGNELGVTARRHVQAIGVEYIGKEANRWEEQYYLGEIPGSQIEYGNGLNTEERLLSFIGAAAKSMGHHTLANAARISRQALYNFIVRKSLPRRSTLLRLIYASANARSAH